MSRAATTRRKHRPSAPAVGPTRVLALLLTLMLTLTACASPEEPVRASREALGTVVMLTAYHDKNADARAADDAIDAAYDAMGAVESELNAHDPQATLARINDVLAGSEPEVAGTMPLTPRIIQTLEAIETLQADRWFSPRLWKATEAWAFEEGGRVPTPTELRAALEDPRFDLGGAAKGLALDEAADALRASGTIEAALISSVSSTLALGAKPDEEPWRIGVEHPREPEVLTATIESRADITVSTSGDYQRFFERDGVRYHHILDPETGLPVRGLQSLTVVGAIPCLDSDILSTALFVAGIEEATAYAERNSLGLVMVDEEGRTHIVPGPERASWRISEEPR